MKTRGIFFNNNIADELIITDTTTQVNTKSPFDFSGLINKNLAESNEAENRELAVKDLLSKLLESFESVDFRELARVENANKLKQKDYIVLVVEEVIKKAKEFNWGLAKNEAFYYFFNGEYWLNITRYQITVFLGEVALKMGVNGIDAKYHNFRNDLFQQFESATYLDKPTIDKDKVLINLKNGTFEVNSEGSELRNFCINDFLTYQLPFEFNETATCPKFDEFLDKVLPEKELQMVLAEFMGYVFAKHLKLEKVLFLYGTGANGKSVFYDIINALLGNTNISSYSLGSLKEEHNRAMITDKLLNYSSELNSGIYADHFKQLASGEKIQARLKYGNSFEMDNYARLAFNCNELPKEVEHTEGFFRRFLIIPFKVTIPEQERDIELASKIIKSELSGVFNWVLKGLNSLLKNKKFTHSELIEKTIAEFRVESDTVQLFLKDENYVKSSKETMRLKELYETYKSYCINYGYRTMNHKNFKSRLEANKYHIIRRSQGEIVYLEKKEFFEPIILSTLNINREVNSENIPF